ncbi:MAG TPA: HAMP domain-containing sensor histidine kinase [Arachidicoccus sp.]
MQNDVHKLNDELQFKSQLISVLSHEAKGLFANFFWMIDAIENGISSPEMLADLLPELKSVANKNLETFTTTLQWIKLQDAAFKPQKALINAYQLFEDMNDFFSKQLSEKKQKLIFSGAKELNFVSDDVLVKLSLKKIIENAIKFSGSGKGIILDISITSGFVEIKVVDSGAGMDEGTLLNLLTGKMKSNGLGLHFTKDMILALDGKINVTSSPEKGSTLTLSLPFIEQIRG